MGCNCKKRIENIKKYSDNKHNEEQINDNLVNKIARIIVQIVVGIIACCIFVIVVIPIIIYLMVCIIIGKEPNIRIKKSFFKKLNGRK